jgi:hypothetical protein
MWTISKLRTHSAVTLTIIGRRVQVGEQIAGAKWAVKRAIQDADQHDRSVWCTQSSRRQIHDGDVNGAAASAEGMPNAAPGRYTVVRFWLCYLGGHVVLQDRLGFDGVPLALRYGLSCPLVCRIERDGRQCPTRSIPAQVHLFRQRCAQCCKRLQVAVGLALCFRQRAGRRADPLDTISPTASRLPAAARASPATRRCSMTANQLSRSFSRTAIRYGDRRPGYGVAQGFYRFCALRGF